MPGKHAWANSAANSLLSRLHALKRNFGSQWSILTKPFRYLVRGLILNVVILFGASLFLLVTIALNYKGRCGVFYFFGGQGRPCPFLEYMKEEFGFYSIVTVAYLWWLILLSFVVVPGIGYLIGRRLDRPKNV